MFCCRAQRLGQVRITAWEITQRVADIQFVNHSVYCTHHTTQEKVVMYLKEGRGGRRRRLSMSVGPLSWGVSEQEVPGCSDGASSSVSVLLKQLLGLGASGPGTMSLPATVSVF